MKEVRSGHRGKIGVKTVTKKKTGKVNEIVYHGPRYSADAVSYTKGGQKECVICVESKEL